MVPLTVVSVVSYRTARQSLRNDAVKALTQAVELKMEFVDAEFENQLQDLKNIAESDATRFLLFLFEENRGNTPTKEFVKNPAGSPSQRYAEPT